MWCTLTCYPSRVLVRVLQLTEADAPVASTPTSTPIGPAPAGDSSPAARTSSEVNSVSPGLVQLTSRRYSVFNIYVILVCF
jgi:hypothetical protein